MTTNILFPEYGTSHVSYALERIFGTSPARLLQQIHYWKENHKTAGYICKKGLKWIYNGAVAWGKQINRSESTVRRAIKDLRIDGILIITQPKAHKRDQTNHYRIDYEAIKKRLISEGYISDEIAHNQSDSLDHTAMTGSTQSLQQDVIQRVPTEITHKEFAAEAAPKPKAKKKVAVSLSGEGSQNPWRSKLAAFMGKVVQTNTHDDYYTDPGEILAKKAQEAIYQKAYAPYAEMPPQTAVKRLCSRYLSKKHNPHQDKKHVEALCAWFEQSPQHRLKPMVDAFVAIKTARVEVHTASYVLRGLRTFTFAGERS